MVFDVNFNKSKFVGGVAVENISGACVGNFGLGVPSHETAIHQLQLFGILNTGIY
jgi:hypothetical protein